jgi:WD40 repeat protein
MAFQLLPTDDIFISYPRKGASTYATGLAEELMKRGFSPFVDKLDARPSADLTKELKAKIRECKMLVVIGTKRAGSRPTIEAEIREYLKTGRNAIVAINFNNALEKARWYPLIRGISLEPEPRVMALKDGQPSESVLNRIETQFNYKRSKARQRKTTISLAALSVLFTIVSFAAAVYAAKQVAAAKQARQDVLQFQGEADRARGERDTARTEMKTAEGERKQAEKDRDEAKDQAREAKGEADKQTDRANQASQRAQDAEQARSAAQNEADRQDKIAKSRSLASAATAYVDDQLDLSLLLGAAAADTADTFEARRSIFSALSHSPYYTGFLARNENSSIASTSYSSLGRKRVAAGGYEGTIRVWDVETREPIGQPMKHPDSDPLRAIALSPDGRTLASGTCRALDPAGNSLAPWIPRGSIALWNLDKGSVKDTPLDSKSVGALSLAFSPNGRYLAAFSCEGAVSFWDLHEATPVRHELAKYTFRGPPGGTLLAFSHDSKLLASVGVVDSISIWDLDKKKAAVPPLSTGASSLTSLAFDPFNEALAIGSLNGSIILWYYKERPVNDAGDVKPCEEETKTEKPEPRALEPESPDNKIVLCYTLAGADVFYHPIRAIGFLDKSHVLAVTGGKELIFWKVGDRSANPPDSLFEDDTTQSEIVNYSLLKGHEGIFSSVSFSPDYMSYITGGSDGSVVFWKNVPNIAEESEAMSDEFNTQVGNPTSVTSHPDPRKHGFAIGSLKGKIIFWDWSRKQEFRPALQTQESPVVHLAFNEDGKKLASVNDNGQVTVWDMENSVRSNTFALPKRLLINEASQTTPFPFPSKDIAFDPELEIIATTSSPIRTELLPLNSVNIVIYDTAGNLLSRLDLEIKSEYVTTFRMSFNPKGKTLAVINYDVVSLWDVSDPRKPHKVKEAKNELSYFGNLAFSHDGTLLATADANGRVTIRTANTLEQKGKPLYLPRGARGSPVNDSGSSALVFSSDDETLASGGGRQEVIYFWDVGRRLFLGEIRSGIPIPVRSMSFSTDSDVLATIISRSRGLYLVFWKWDLASLTKVARRVANRELTIDEKENEGRIQNR